MGQEELESLYNQLGEPKIRQLVDAFYAHVYQDPILIPLFKNDIAEIKDKQFRFLTQFFGGPQLYIEKYGPPKMRMRHMPHKIDQRAMESWLICMQKAIDTLDLPKDLAHKLYNSFPKLAQHMINS
jgi:hemoglobin